MKRGLCCIVFFALLAAAAFPADEGGASLLAGAGVSRMFFTDRADRPFVYGASLALDYALFPVLSVGFEGGAHVVGDGDGRFATMPVLARLGVHLGFAFERFDVYAVFKFGYAFGASSGAAAYGGVLSGLVVGADLGLSYFFTGVFGVFFEGGYERFTLARDGYGRDGVFADKYASAGVAFKFGG
ncbi:MAG: hypothetical protein LBS82_02380 [Spirochaetaceae bacterium]|nr:hypothetical protein [Spirochaetaceae bacterium]